MISVGAVSASGSVAGFSSDNLSVQVAAPGVNVDVACEEAAGTAEGDICFKRAVEILAKAGFSQLSDQVAGFDAGKDAFGRTLPGWGRTTLPVGKGKPVGQAYADVKTRTAR